MTTRHTISHADELYSGNAYQASASSDGRRGIKMTHLYSHEFLATDGAMIPAGDADGIFSSFAATAIFVGASAKANLLSLASGALTGTTGATLITFDHPRNLCFRTCNNATAIVFKFEGGDQYGEAMCESIRGGAGGAYTSGARCFKTLSKIYATMTLTGATVISMGQGNRYGLPFHLSNVGKLISVSRDGYSITASLSNAGNYLVHTGASSATTMTSSGGQPDARGSVQIVAPAMATDIRYTALMEVDHRTRRTAYGPPQVSSCTDGIA